MQKYQDHVTDQYGNAQKGASVLVKTAAGATATIYSDDGVTEKDNPITTGANGAFEFYAANGSYVLNIDGVDSTRFTLLDVSEAATATPTSASTVVGETGGVVKRFAKTSLGPLVNVMDPAYGAVADGTTDDYAAFAAALATGKNVFVPSGTYRINSKLSVSGQSLIGENPSTTKLYSGTVAGEFMIEFDSGQRGATLENFSIEAQTDGLSGVFVSGAVNARVMNLYIVEFTGTAFRLGNASAGQGAYWSKISLIRIGLNGAKNGATGFLVDGGAIPNTNDNSCEDVLISGTYNYPLHIKGQGNTFKNGTIELTRGTEITSMIYIEGSGNRVQDVYLEPLGTPPATVVKFGAGCSGNNVEVWPQFSPTYNAYASVTDAGEHNKVKFKRVGGNYKVGPEAENTSNLVMNSEFRVWRDASNPDGWQGGTARISRVAATGTADPTILRMTESASASTIQYYINDYLPATSGGVPMDLSYFQGKPIIAGVWCRTSVAGAGNVKVWGQGGTAFGLGGDKHSGGGGWELLTAHAQVPAGNTRLWMELRSESSNSNITGTVDFKDPFFIVGTDVIYFSPKPMFDTGGKMTGDLEFPLDYSDKGLGGIIRLNGSYLWVDTTGKLRIGATRPTNATWDSAGGLVGAQS